MLSRTTARRLTGVVLAAAIAMPAVPAAQAMPLAVSKPVSAESLSQVTTVSERGRRNAIIGAGVAIGVLGVAAAAAAERERRKREYYYYYGGGQPYYSPGYAPGPVYVQPQPQYYAPTYGQPSYDDDDEVVYRSPRVIQQRGAQVNPRGKVRYGKCWIVTNQDTQAGYWGRCY